jgi:hypothetical protein
MPPEEEQKPKRTTSSRLKETPNLTSRTKDEKGTISCGQSPRTRGIVAKLKATTA